MRYKKVTMRYKEVTMRYKKVTMRYKFGRGGHKKVTMRYKKVTMRYNRTPRSQCSSGFAGLLDLDLDSKNKT